MAKPGTPGTPTTPTALGGLRVLDLSRILAGPWCAMILGDLGAEVIKVESPGHGDDTRLFGPPFQDGESAYFQAANRNKKSLVVDLKSIEGQGIIRELAAGADVVIENFRNGQMEKFGLGLGDLRAANPKLITCSISGYGRESPMAERAGYDFMIQAESGLMSIIGEPDGDPMKVGVAISDLITGNNAAQAVLAALLARHNTGRGQHIDMALLDCQVAALANVASAYLMTGEAPDRQGNAHSAVAPYEPFKTADEPIALAIGNNRQFAALCEALGLIELASDPRYADNALRVKNRATLAPALEAVFITDGRDGWLQKLHAAGLPAGAIRTIDEVLESPEIAARGMIHDIDHPAMGKTKLLGSPLKLSGTPVIAPQAPPTLGQHTVEVLTGVLGWEQGKAEAYAERLG
ncbi:MAG: CoA transferase [Rhodospirillales bacterium]|nr:CoA transferase [Rhodospirillales bacterium]